MGEERGVYRILLGKPDGKRPLGKPRRRWVDNIRTDLQEVECGYMDWIGLAQDRNRWRTLVSAVMNLQIPWNAGNFLTSCKPLIFSRRTLHHGVSKKIFLCLLSINDFFSWNHRPTCLNNFWATVLHSTPLTLHKILGQSSDKPSLTFPPTRDCHWDSKSRLHGVHYVSPAVGADIEEIVQGFDGARGWLGCHLCQGGSWLWPHPPLHFSNWNWLILFVLVSSLLFIL